MTRRIIFSAALFFSLVSLANAETFTVDTAHTRIGFAVKHMVISSVQGEFMKFGGSLDLDGKNRLVKAEATVETASVNTREEKRDAHLKSPDFFDAQMYPEIKFQSKKVSIGGGKLTVTGDLTIKNVTKPVTLTGEMSGPIKGMMGETRVGFHAEGKINRKDFGVNFHKLLDTGGLVVDDEVKIILDIEGTPKGWAPPAPK
ncbi:MAG: polyisoprenoid-binding protein [Nitrospinae bacterium]|nr:polyisoprenoid-binding protein [Nitrospinota bacterium]